MDVVCRILSIGVLGRRFRFIVFPVFVENDEDPGSLPAENRYREEGGRRTREHTHCDVEEVVDTANRARPIGSVLSDRDGHGKDTGEESGNTIGFKAPDPRRDCQ